MSKVALIIKYLGVPYKNEGRTMEGLDCWGFVMLAYKEILGIDISSTIDGYGNMWSWRGKDYIKEECEKKKDIWTRVTEAKETDLILFKNSKGISNHLGIMLDNKNFIHCAKAGVVLGHIREKSWLNRIEGFFRYNDKNN